MKPLYKFLVKSYCWSNAHILIYTYLIPCLSQRLTLEEHAVETWIQGIFTFGVTQAY